MTPEVLGCDRWRNEELDSATCQIRRRVLEVTQPACAIAGPVLLPRLILF